MFVDTRPCKLRVGLCQNCVTSPPKPWGNTVIYEETSTHIGVAEVVESEVRWWDLMCVSTRERIQFPSVRLQPLGHLSVFRINSLPAVQHELWHTPARSEPFCPIIFSFSGLQPDKDVRAPELCQTF
jgi:hypothetical protein